MLGERQTECADEARIEQVADARATARRFLVGQCRAPGRVSTFPHARGKIGLIRCAPMVDAAQAGRAFESGRV